MKTLFVTLLALPLLVIPMIIYAFIGSGEVIGGEFTTSAGDTTVITRGHALVILGALLLACEMIKSTSIKASSIVDHILSVALLLVSALIFWSVPGFGTGTFLTLVVLQFIDVVVGVVVTIRVAKRDFGLPMGGL